MRLGVPLHTDSDDPAAIARAYADNGYSAAVCPKVTLDEPERIQAIREAFARADVMLAEVGVWNNMLDPDPERRAANIAVNLDRLAVAEEVGVRCCVNIAGTFHPTKWAAPHPHNLSEEAFEQTVQNVRYIIDMVQPKRAYYCIEAMPNVIPDSVESYVRLLDAIDRPMFGVHLDPVNIITSPDRYFHNAALLRECFARLGHRIVSCHAKDILLRDGAVVHLDEVRPGLGTLDYAVFLKELARLPGDIPLIIEHLPQDEYPIARDYILGVATQLGLSFCTPRGAK